MTIAEFQQLIRDIYYERDSARGLAATFMWLVEEVGELARALQNNDTDAARAEFADVMAWLATTASIAGVDLEAAVRARYEQGCPKCAGKPCVCERGKP